MSNNHFNFISRAKFDELVENYLNSISPDRRAKAIMTQEIVSQAIAILSGSDTTANPRYKHW
ncbi:11353_t:CDS:1, partial [Paraglomus occultum]